MGAYLDRLNAEYDECRDGITAIVDRAAEEKRDVTDAEQATVDRSKERLARLETAIGDYSDLETRNGKVAELRRSVPAATVTRTTAAPEPEYDVNREFPTAADYAITVHRATALRDPEAQEKLDRATTHQVMSLNPGLIPRPILGPVINHLNASRPFINSCVRRPLPGPAFDRPVVTQHVAVAEQSAEKTLTASNPMRVDKLPVSAKTFAGHLNISRQDIKWTSPGILQIVFDDFVGQYALATCTQAVTDFMAALTGNTAIPIATADPAGIAAAFYGAAANAVGSAGVAADTLFASPDMWGKLGSLIVTQTGMPAFPSLSLDSTSGNPMGLSLVVDEHFPDGTLIMGPRSLNEYYEDVDGLLQVGEPDVLGQLVGYAGYSAFLNLRADAFSVFTWPVAGP